MIDYVNKPAPEKPNRDLLANVVLGVIVGLSFLLTVLSCFLY